MSEIITGLLFQCGISELEEELSRVPVSLLVDLEGSDVGMTRARNYFRWPIVDGPLLPDLDVLQSVVDLIIAYLDNSEPVVVHCAAGINRAGLVVSEVVRWRMNLSGKEAVQWVRDHRPGALTNTTFSNFLESQ